MDGFSQVAVEERYKIALDRTSVGVYFDCQNAEKFLRMNSMSTAKTMPLTQRGVRLQRRFCQDVEITVRRTRKDQGHLSVVA